MEEQRGQKRHLEEERVDLNVQANLEPFQLNFVNRNKETLELMDTLLTNAQIAEQRGKQKPYLVIAAQMFGSGKSEMGAHAVLQAQRLCNEQSALREAMVQRFGEPLVSRYLNARYIEVDMTFFKAKKAKLDLSLAFLLYRSFLRAFGAVTEVAVPFSTMPQELETMEDVVYYFLHQEKDPKMGEKGEVAFFLHLDEVGKIESNAFDEAFPGWKGIDHSTTDVTTCLVRYYQVWEALEPLLRLPNIFLFATAKQPGFALIGQKLVPSLQSPSNLCAVVLGRLDADHVAETIRTTPVREQENRLLFTILQDAGLTKELLAHLCKTLVEHTAGLPRLIDRVSLS